MLLVAIAVVAACSSPKFGDGGQFASGGLTRVAHGVTLLGSGTSTNNLDVNTSVIQNRVTGTCVSPNAIASVASDGTVTCSTPTSTSLDVTIFGTGIDGSCTCFDGTTACQGYTPSSGVYGPLTRSLHCTNLTVGGSAKIKTGQWKLEANGLCAINGNVNADGAGGTGATKGTALGTGYFGAGIQGTDATTGAGTTGGASTTGPPVPWTTLAVTGGTAGASGGTSGGAPATNTCAGGGGGGSNNANGGVGGGNTQASSGAFGNIFDHLRFGGDGRSFSTAMSFGAAGGSGAGGGVSAQGGGPGGGGGLAWLACKTMSGSGSVTANGGNGGNGITSGGNEGGGGGGGGGGIAVVSYQHNNGGGWSISANGGTHGTKGAAGAGDGGDGGSCKTFVFSGDGT